MRWSKRPRGLIAARMVSGRAVASMNALGVGQSSKNAEIALCCAGQTSQADETRVRPV